MRSNPLNNLRLVILEICSNNTVLNSLNHRSKIDLVLHINNGLHSNRVSLLSNSKANRDLMTNILLSSSSSSNSSIKITIHTVSSNNLTETTISTLKTNNHILVKGS